MLKNYIKIALRNLWRTRTFSIINIVGLATGLCCFILIMLFVSDELSYDRHFSKADRIFRINSDIKFGGAESQYPFSSDMMGAALQNDYPEVENYARLYTSSGNKLIKKGTQYITEARVAHADSTFFSIFDAEAITGNLQSALHEPNTVVLTESAALKYFGTTDALGKILETRDDDNPLYKVTAVIKELPTNTHFNLQFFFSMKNADYEWGQWLSHNFHTYLLLKPGVNYQEFANKAFPQYSHKYLLPAAQELMQISSYDEFEQSGNKLHYSLTPVTEIHLYSSRVYEMTPGGNIQYIYIFAATAIFILAIACINFTNLTTAKSTNRAREVGIRKVLGTTRKNLSVQFLSESVLLAMISTIIASGLVIVFLPLFNNLAGKNIQVSALGSPFFVVMLLLLAVITGLIAGFYPALVLSSFKPIEVLRGKMMSRTGKSSLRSCLVVFQFATSIILIIATTIIYNQLHYIQNKNIGYNKDQVVIIDRPYALGNNSEAFKQFLLQQPGVINATYSSFLPTPSSRSDNLFSKEAVFDMQRSFNMQEWYVDDDYIATLGMTLIKGRNFSKEFGTDSSAVILNETAAALLGHEDPIGKTLYRAFGDNTKKYTVIGVVKNFHYESLKRDIDMLGLFYGKSLGTMALRIHAVNISEVFSAAENKWKALAPEMPFSYSFMNANFRSVYESEERIGKIAISFSVLAIVIACLGLFGLATFIAEQRTKEIGVRKVLGASIHNLVLMLSKDFLKLVAVATVIAFPIAWWCMNSWLQNFAYRTSIGWWTFAGAGLIAVLIALLTVSSQAIRAAYTNPIKSLRTE